MLFCPPRNVRRAASMDAAIASATAEADPATLEHLPKAAPEVEQIGGRRKRFCVNASGSGHWSNFSTNRPDAGGIARSALTGCLISLSSLVEVRSLIPWWCLLLLQNGSIPLVSLKSGRSGFQRTCTELAKAVGS
ncbi:hypothetical protein PVAP13_1KG157000 [Panicum virgatum]|uniref:Uncharacterized protein n=1 Tax=Panicum virgatum TaxID=38727 RepID=A0A8T0XEC1_PANVG|nr:hypothetical protein PVAP13_1KG157000 [Panicum virgatum]